ncbi:PPK2 family polyphosphate kinase [Sinomicrobium weinanense]|uniref:Polyphosphate kinase 2 family protein n=1 Tax=Sinomicrobium weinanense TaxID=2842200 RepID=A0A926Q0R1_9FLAO|nr:PPK2 family polyphosphate kinase [Sinomicrobium weinanense]MBC9795157.1 polyphosphate kinase 2 family protein [Sinomicrobium weinanense]MBU3121934.1 polyphosphate kinase 2 family protein [Sinomicrobium weinanense]
MEKIKTSDYRVGKEISLKEIPTLNTLGATEEELEKALAKERNKLAKFQNRMYAHGKYGVLICIQGMDTAGKDSLIREVFKDLNARGVVVHSFKTPSVRELRHDYLWRHYMALPERGKFSVFNRTHYENVLVTRVHPEYILNENIPGIESTDNIGPGFWSKRFEQINNFEKHAVENGTIIFKFFLHLSKEEQRHRLLRRLNKENKNWKFSPGDLKERKLWDNYQKCYEEAINHTSTAHAPWYVIPADNKKASRLILADILYDELKEYKDVREPELNHETRAHLEDYKKQLEGE